MIKAGLFQGKDNTFEYNMTQNRAKEIVDLIRKINDYGEFAISLAQAINLVRGIPEKEE